MSSVALSTGIAGRGPAAPVEPTVSGQIDRLVRSELLCRSGALCRLLRYLGESHELHPGVPVKEHVLGTEVLGRRPDFDPRADACVRIQVGRLRSKLNRYYAGPGASDPIVILIPKGAYLLMVRHRKPARSSPERRPAPLLVPPAPVPARRSWILPSLLFATVLLFGMVLSAMVRMRMVR